MLSPKVGKSRFGHLNALAKSGVQPFVYRRNAHQLLGLKRQAIDYVDKQNSVMAGSYPFRYLNTVAESGEQQVTNNIEGQNSSVPPYKNEQDLSDKNHTFNKVDKTDSELFLEGEREDGLISSKNAQPSYSRQLQQQLSKPSRSRFLNTSEVLSQEKNHRIESLQPEVERKHLVELPQIDKELEKNKANHSSNKNTILHEDKNLQLAHNHRTKVNQDISNVDDKEGVEPLLKSRPKIYSENKAIKRHQQLTQRYQELAQRSPVSSNFIVDEKTRAAMNRMQEKLGLTEKEKIQKYKNVGRVSDVQELTAKDVSRVKSKTAHEIKPLQPTLINILQRLPKKKNTMSKKGSKDTVKIVEIQRELKSLELKIEALNKENLRHRKEIAHLEAHQSRGTGKNTTAGSNRNSGSFLERNRLTHAMIRMRT